MNKRIEAAAKAVYDSPAEGCSCCAYYDHDNDMDAAAEIIGADQRTMLVAQAALAAADAVMFSDEALERVERALTKHAVITDGLEEGYGWCAECGNVDADNEAHQARAVVAALKAES